MPPQQTYLLDANTFIEAHRRYYGFDICPGFWKSLVWLHGQGSIQSVDRVHDELMNGQGVDALKKWAKSVMPAAAFASTNDPLVLEWFGKVQTWVQTNKQFLPAAKQEFASCADGWLIAYAKAHDLILVTHEVLDPLIKKRVPIPNVCKAFDVVYTDTFEVLRQCGIKLEWDSAS